MTKSCQENEKRELAVMFMAHPILKDGTPIECSEMANGLAFVTTSAPKDQDHQQVADVVRDYFSKQKMDIAFCQQFRATTPNESKDPKFKDHFHITTTAAYTDNRWRSFGYLVVYAVVAEVNIGGAWAACGDREDSEKTASYLIHHLDTAISSLPTAVRVEANQYQRPPTLTTTWAEQN